MMTLQLVQAAEAHKVHHSLSRIMDLVPVRANCRRSAAAVAAARVAISSTARHVVKSSKHQRILQQEQQHNMRRLSRSAPPTGLHAWGSGMGQGGSCPGDTSPHSSAIESMRSMSAERRTASWQAVQSLYNEQTEGSQERPLAPGSFAPSSDQNDGRSSASSPSAQAEVSGSAKSCASSHSIDRASRPSSDAEIDPACKEKSAADSADCTEPSDHSGQAEEHPDEGIKSIVAHRIDIASVDLQGGPVVGAPKALSEGVTACAGHQRSTGHQSRESKGEVRESTSWDGFDISGASVAGFFSGDARGSKLTD